MSTPATSELVDAMVGAYQRGQMERVITLAAQAGETPDESITESITVLLALARQALGQHEPALAAFRQLCGRQPEVSAHWNNLGVACRDAGELAESEQAFLRARSLAPNDAEVLYNLGLLYMQQRRWPEARESLMDAVQLSPQFIDARLQTAHACYVCADNAGQEAMLSNAADWPPQAAEQALLLSSMLCVQGDMETALHTLERAQLPEREAGSLMRLRMAAKRMVLFERSNLLQRAQNEREQLPLTALDRLPASAGQVRADGWSAHAALYLREGEPARAAELYRRVLTLDIDNEGRAGAGFGLATACHKLGRHDDAWRALGAAHDAQLAIAREVVPELLAQDSQPLEMTNHFVDSEAYAGWTSMASPQAHESPVFVVGFPRSGTTLLEQMLDAHVDFCSMDERAFIHDLTERMETVGQRYPQDLASLTAREVEQLRTVYRGLANQVRPDLGARCLVDKNPLNMLCLPMIMRLFPKARIILCLRHPCDVLLSCYMQAFRSPAFMVLCSSLERLARGYVRAFEQWDRHVQTFAPDVLRWRYETVVGDLDGAVARLGDFLGVDDSTSMARFAEHARSKRFISTPSYAQVTQGIQRSSVNRWHAYHEHFGRVLPTLQPWIERLGYAE